MPVPAPAPAPVPVPASKPAAAAEPVASVPAAVSLSDGPLVPEEDESEQVVGKQPFYKTWWFWTIVGVAVVGAGTAAGILASQGDGNSGVVEFSPWGDYAPLDVTLYPGRN